jgi:hypothetical protein
MLRVPGRTAVPATVVDIQSSTMTAVLARPGGLHAWEGAELFVEWAAGVGFRRCSGRLLPVELGRSELAVVTLAGRPELVHRRRWSRVDVVRPVWIELVDEPLSGGETTTVNIGAGGILFTDPWRLRVGAVLSVSLEMGDELPAVRAIGQVVRQARPDQKGMRFDDITSEDRARLVQLVYEHERELIEMRLATGF